MNTLENKPIGEIVAEDYRTAFVFKNYGIEYCCGGKKTLTSACTSKNISVDEILAEIESVLHQSAQENKYNEWSLSFLIDYIINNHHKYVQEKLPFLLFLAEKVARVHGGEHSELVQMHKLVNELNAELLNHLNKEEGLTFPLIKKLETEAVSPKAEEFLISELEDEHETTGSVMEQLSQLSSGYQYPENACSSYQIYFKTLQEFQDDLHKHVHLENNILFPRTEQMLQT